MAITVKHSKVSTIPDGTDTSVVRPSDWNADHTLVGMGTMAEQNANSVAITGGSINGTSVGATTAASGKFTTVDIASGLTLATQAGTSGQILSSTGAGTVPVWIDNYATQMKMTVKNDQGTNLTKGQVVYVSGANGTNVLVKLAQANSDITSATTIGFLEQDLAVNGIGLVVLSGSLAGIDTSAATAGDPIWLSGTTAGSVVYGVSNKPKAPTHLVYLGVVTRAQAINGEIDIKVNNGWELEELHDVQVTSPSNGQTILYDAANSLWKNANLTAGTGVSVTNGASSVTIANTGVTSAVAGTGISVSSATGAVTVTNTAPDQTVSLTGAGGTTVTGTYPNFTISSSSGGSGTVTSVSALTLGTTGTDLSSTVANSTTTPVITLNVPTASATNRGVLSSTDWTTFNNKGNGTVTSVGGTGTVNGISLSGTVTSSGNLTLGGTLSDVSLTTQVSGTLPLANGGTNATSAAGAYANILGFTTTATTGGTTTLTNTSTPQHHFTGTSAQTIQLPDVTTLSLGWTFEITNNSTNILTVNSSGGNLVNTLSPGGTGMFTCIAVTGTTAASWDSGFNELNIDARMIPQNAQTGNYTIATTDIGKHIYHASGAGAAVYTIPANSAVPFEIGTAITFINMSATAPTIAITTDTMYLAGTGTTGTRTLAQYGVATAIKLTATTWIISGSGLT